LTVPRAVGNQRLSITVWATLPRHPAPAPATTPNHSRRSAGEVALPVAAMPAPQDEGPGRQDPCLPEPAHQRIDHRGHQAHRQVVDRERSGRHPAQGVEVAGDRQEEDGKRVGDPLDEDQGQERRGEGGEPRLAGPPGYGQIWAR
jgi:hypothetical protein